jgi:hypothetical protein
MIWVDFMDEKDLESMEKLVILFPLTTSNLTAASPDKLRKHTSQKTERNCNHRITQQDKK